MNFWQSRFNGHEVDPPVFGRVELSGWKFGVLAVRFYGFVKCVGLTLEGYYDDAGLLFVVFGVQYVMRDSFAAEYAGNLLGLFDGTRPHEHGLSAFPQIVDLCSPSTFYPTQSS